MTDETGEVSETPIPEPAWHRHERKPIEKGRLGKALTQIKTQRTEQISKAANERGFRLKPNPGNKPTFG